MRIARAALHCAECGKWFSHARIVAGREAVATYCAWAHRHIKLCPTCARQARREGRTPEPPPIRLPELYGTAKQVAWAEKLRAAYVARREDELRTAERRDAMGFAIGDVRDGYVLDEAYAGTIIDMLRGRG